MSTLPERILCLVTDLDRAGGESNMLRIVRDTVRGGVNMVQVRAHELNESQLTAFTGAVVREVDDDAIVVVNGSPLVATGADGIHLREQTKIASGELPTGMLTGRSVHSLKAALDAEAEGVDYIMLGTVFPSASHPGGVTGGTDMVSLVAREVNVPVIGIGGITAENTDQVIAAGAAGVAVIGAIIDSDIPFEAAKALAVAAGVGERR